MTDNLEQKVLAKAQSWLDGDYDADTKAQVKSLMESDMTEHAPRLAVNYVRSLLLF